MNDLMVKFKGALTAVTPLTTAPKHVADRQRDREPMGLPTANVVRDGVVTEVMYMPGSGVRGSLRDAAFDMLKRPLEKAAGGPVLDIDDIYLNAKGGVKGAGAEVWQPERIARIRRENPLMSLFGGGDPWIDGKLKLSNKMTDLPLRGAEGRLNATRFSGVRKENAEKTSQILAPEHQEGWLREKAIRSERSAYTTKVAELEKQLKKGGVVDLRGDMVKEFTKDDVANIKEQIKELTEKVDDLQKEAKSTVSVQLVLEGFLAIPENAELSSSIDLLRVRKLDLGFFLATLEEFAFQGAYIGGHKNVGCGKVSGEWEVTTYHLDNPKDRSNGTIKLTSMEPLEITGDYLKEAYDEFQAWHANNFSLENLRAK